MALLYKHDIYRPWYSALPVGLFWTSVLVALAYVESLAAALRWVFLLVTTPMALAALFHYFHSVARVHWAARTYGRHLPEFMRRMVLVFPRLARFRSEATKVLLHLALAMFGLVLASVTGTYSVLLPSALLLGIATTAFLRVVLPPAGVYLASSDPDRISFFGQLSKLTKFGFAALLEVSNFADPNQKGFFGKAFGLLNDFRTTDPCDWPDVVKQLIEMAALVVVDGRDRSPGVEFEVKRILRNRLEFKTAFLSTDGKLPSLLTHLNAKSSHPSGTFLVMTPDQALQALPARIKAAKTFWIPVYIDAEPGEKHMGKSTA
jgi:hypothetical protein